MWWIPPPPVQITTTDGAQTTIKAVGQARRAGAHQRKAQGQRHDDHYEGIEAELLVVQQRPEVALEQHPVLEGEVAAGEEHEQGDDPGDGIVPVPHDRLRMGRKAAGRKGREGVADRVEERHAGQSPEGDLQQGKQEVDEPQGFGGMGDPGGELILGGSGGLGKEDPSAGDTEPDAE